VALMELVLLAVLPLTAPVIAVLLELLPPLDRGVAVGPGVGVGSGISAGQSDEPLMLRFVPKGSRAAISLQLTLMLKLRNVVHVSQGTLKRTSATVLSLEAESLSEQLSCAKSQIVTVSLSVLLEHELTITELNTGTVSLATAGGAVVVFHRLRRESASGFGVPVVVGGAVVELVELVLLLPLQRGCRNALHSSSVKSATLMLGFMASTVELPVARVAFSVEFIAIWQSVALQYEVIITWIPGAAVVVAGAVVCCPCTMAASWRATAREMSQERI